MELIFRLHLQHQLTLQNQQIQFSRHRNVLHPFSPRWLHRNKLMHTRENNTFPIMSKISDPAVPMSAALSPLGTLSTLPHDLRDEIYSLVVAQDGREYIFQSDKKRIFKHSCRKKSRHFDRNSSRSFGHSLCSRSIWILRGPQTSHLPARTQRHSIREPSLTYPFRVRRPYG